MVKKRTIKVRQHIRRNKESISLISQHHRKLRSNSNISNISRKELNASLKIEKRRQRYYNKPIPISVCSFRKANVDKALPAELYTCTRLKGFNNKFGDKNYIVLSRKYGLMFNDEKYEQYEDIQELDESKLLALLIKQRELYPDLELLYYNPRPLTGSKYYFLLQRAGFKINDFNKLADFPVK